MPCGESATALGSLPPVALLYSEQNLLPQSLINPFEPCFFPYHVPVKVISISIILKLTVTSLSPSSWTFRST